MLTRVTMTACKRTIAKGRQLGGHGFHRLATNRADRATAGYLTAVLLLSLMPMACYGPIHGSRTTGTAPNAPSGPSLDQPNPQGRTARLPAPNVGSIQSEPMVRVRIEGRVNQVDLTADTALILRVFPDAGTPYELTAAINIQVMADGFRITPQGGAGALDWPAGALSIRAADGGTIQIGERRYPGQLVVHRRTDANTRMDVINYTPLETYVVGVITKELYGNWHLEAFKAQAVAARSYFFYEQFRNARRHYDLESTTASQVYAGASSNPTAIAAGRATAGEVLTWNSQVLPTFYSADNGRFGADAARVFPNIPDVPPLRGAVHIDIASNSPHAQWTVTRDTATLARRFAAWGRARNHPIAALDGLTAIQVAATNTAGRPSAYRIVDGHGNAFELKGENLRLASNFSGSGLPDVGGARLKSSALTASLNGRTITLNGEGFGHGVGMSQWGAQDLAVAGQVHHQILARYYPGATIRKAY